MIKNTFKKYLLVILGVVLVILPGCMSGVGSWTSDIWTHNIYPGVSDMWFGSQQFFWKGAYIETVYTWNGTDWTNNITGSPGAPGPPGSTGLTGQAGPNSVNSSTTSTNITGLIKGNGSFIQTAISGMDYAPFVYNKVNYQVRIKNAASGNVSYSGVGFKPRGLIVMASTVVSSTVLSSLGISDNTGYSVSQCVLGGNPVSTQEVLIFLYTNGFNYQFATVASYDSNGYTLTWVSAGTLTTDFSWVVLAYK